MAHGLAFSECVMRAQEWMKTYGGSELGMFIAEDAPRVKRFIKAVHAKFQDPSSEIFEYEDIPVTPLLNIIDTIHFAQKRETSLLQIADACAFVVKRALMEKEDSRRFIRPILSALLWPEERLKKFTDSVKGN